MKIPLKGVPSNQLLYSLTRLKIRGTIPMYKNLKECPDPDIFYPAGRKESDIQDGDPDPGAGVGAGRGEPTAG